MERLLEVLNRLVDLGNTVLVIEHHPGVVKTADHVIDLGPEGGEKGGEIWWWRAHRRRSRSIPMSHTGQASGPATSSGSQHRRGHESPSSIFQILGWLLVGLAALPDSCRSG